MNFRILPALLLAWAAFALSACSPKPIIDENAVFSTVRENVNAMQNKDINGVMATIHPDCPAYANTKEDLGELFKKYDLRFTLTDLKMVSATPEEVKVSFEQKTEKISGAEGV